MRKVAWWVWAVAGIVLVAGVFSRYASDSPDGLESVIESEGISVSEGAAPLPDYGTPGVEAEGVSVFVAAAVGIAVVFVVTYGLGKVLSWRGRSSG